MSVAYDVPPRVRRVRPQAPAVVLPFPRPIAGPDSLDEAAAARHEVALASPPETDAPAPTRRGEMALGVAPAGVVVAPVDDLGGPIDYAGAPVDGARRLIDGSRVAADLRGPIACPSSRPARDRSVGDLAAPDTRDGRLRLTARGRRLRALVCACALVTAGWITVSAIHSAVSSPVIPSSAPAVVQVHPGDTLWSIATQIAPRQDPRRVVAALRSVNHLASNTVRVGQQLRVPH